MQQAVLDRLEACGGNEDLHTLAAKVFHPDRWEYQGEYYFRDDPDPPGYDCTDAEYSSVQRAAQALERRGMVETEIRNPRMPCRGEATLWKVVRLSVVTNVMGTGLQHLDQGVNGDTTS